jgi:hypothetical protein
MSDVEAKACLETIKNAKLITRLIDSDNWLDIGLSEHEREILGTWRQLAQERPDIVNGAHPDIWLPGCAIIMRFAKSCASLSKVAA